MKTTLLALILTLTGLELWAQQGPPGMNNTAASRRAMSRLSNTNGPVTQPRYQPAAPGATGVPGAQPGMQPGGAPGGLGGSGVPGAPGAAPAVPLSSTYSASSTFAAKSEEMIAPGLIDFEGVEVTQVLDIYAKLVNRTLLRAGLPTAQIILKTQTPLTKTEAIEALQAVLALNGIAVVNIGEKFVKVLAVADANSAGANLDDTSVTNLPNLGSYITHITQLKYIKPSVMIPFIQPFGKLQGGLSPIDDNGILVMRDYAENIKRMLEMIDKIDVSVPAEYVSEVIPIRYAKVDDIASALNSLGGGGGGSPVSIGTSPSSGQISGVAGSRMGGMSGMGGMGGSMGGGGYQSGGMGGGGAFGGQNRGGMGGGATPNGTPNNATTFQQRLQNIIGATARPGGTGGGGGSQDQIQLFGQTKIIPNESSSSLLIYATRADLEVIKGIIAKLDVPLAQVLIEAVIMDVTIGHTFDFGVSAAQKPMNYNAAIPINGAGGYNNGGFMSLIQSVVTNGFIGHGSNAIPIIGQIVSAGGGTNGAFGNSLSGGSSWFGNIGPNWDVAVQAAQTDSRASIIQRPRIQTSQAKPAQFFVGETVPYVTGSTYGSAYGNSSSYSQLSVGVELDVTPYINPEGLVVMEIQQEIDDLNGYTEITGVGKVPNTIKRTLNAEIAVRNLDTVMLGGFIKSDKSHSQSGVPFLSDIPILGNLFKKRSDSKDRQELIVLIRPTVLATPELAAKHTVKEEQRLPGVSGAAAEDAEYERKLIDAERKREQKSSKSNRKAEGFFLLPTDMETNFLTAPVEAVPSSTSNPPPTEPSADVDAANPLPLIEPEIQVETPQIKTNVPAAPIVPVTQSPTRAPAADNGSAQLDAAAKQQKVAAVLAQKMMELNSTNAPH